MIYFDNAATTKYKPDRVYEAVNYYLREIGTSPGRGSYQLGIQASRMLYQARTSVGKYFGMTDPDRVIFTKNSTEAINLCFRGLLHHGDHVIISCYEHNAVLRPLETLKREGIVEYTIVQRDDLQLPADELFAKYAKPNTRMLAMTLASNLTGRIVYRKDVYKCFKEKGILTFLDSSQGAGKLRPQMFAGDIDFLAFTGHKDLLAIPGVGGLCCQSQEHLKPLIQGGTGIHGECFVNPDIFPEGYEAGTLNMPAIWSLHESIAFLKDHQEANNKAESKLTDYLMSRLKELDNVYLYDLEAKRVGTCCFNVKGVPSDKVVAALDRCGICVRGGIHCAILAHEALGTVQTGAVRASLSYNNTIEEVDTFIHTISEMR